MPPMQPDKATRRCRPSSRNWWTRKGTSLRCGRTRHRAPGRCTNQHVPADQAGGPGRCLPRQDRSRSLPLAGSEREGRPEVAAWVEAENEVTFDYLQSIPEREVIKKRLTELWDYEKFTAPFKAGGRYFFRKNDGLQNQSVLYVMDSLDGEPRVLIDPNTWSDDGTVALAGNVVQRRRPLPRLRHRRGRLRLADAGGCMDIDTGQDLDDELNWIKFSGASWTDGRQGASSTAATTRRTRAANSRRSTSTRSSTTTASARPSREDVLVYHRPDQPDWGFGADGHRGRPLPGHHDLEGHRRQVPRPGTRTSPSRTACRSTSIDNFDARVHVRRQRRPGVLLQDRPRRAARPASIAIDIAATATGALAARSSPRPSDTLRGVSLVGQPVRRLATSQDAKSRGASSIAPTGGSVRDVELPGHRLGRAASAASGPTRRPSTPSPASPRRRASTATT